MFAGIPLKRLLAYALMAGALPLIFTAFLLFNRFSDFQQVEQQIAFIQESILAREAKQAVNLSTRDQYAQADHFYIDKQIESIRLLEPEVETLKKIASQNNVVDNEALKRRLDFLTNSNTIVFTEGVVQKLPYFNETLETLVHPVEVNVDNIIEILAKIEGVEIGPYAPGADRPQMIIIDFKLDKRELEDKHEIFQLNLKLLKREFT